MSQMIAQAILAAHVKGLRPSPGKVDEARHYLWTIGSKVFPCWCRKCPKSSALARQIARVDARCRGEVQHA